MDFDDEEDEPKSEYHEKINGFSSVNSISQMFRAYEEKDDKFTNYNSLIVLFYLDRRLTKN